jgi:hypothetical protein
MLAAFLILLALVTTLVVAPTVTAAVYLRRGARQMRGGR